MNREHEILSRAVGNALSGKGGHVEVKGILDGLDWKVAGTRPGSVPHSLFQILNHLAYWQDWVVKWLDGEKPPIPKHASGSWPGLAAPASSQEWERAVRHFQNGLSDLERRSRESDLFVKNGNKSRLEMFQAIASHNSYHAGQAVFLRRMLDAWPPPSGGITW
jgi:uncharacterized damage-inducible protein DinB